MYSKTFKNGILTPLRTFEDINVISFLLLWFVVHHKRHSTIPVLSNILLLLSLSTLIVAVISVNGKVHIEFSTRTQLHHLINSYETTPHIAITKIQLHYQCCGIKNITDWETTYTIIKNNTSVPDSCCKHLYETCGRNQLILLNNVNIIGCFDVISEKYRHKYGLLATTNFCLMIALFINAINGFIIKQHFTDNDT
ncbi:unnamed protein product [Didymodactylos carnosus]|uniref:Tetraspanin n=1 Tax=Didymodactylos carnosus TaxID=1234261 RepID=A0A815GE26_9BILA|nr:unnamed protein product [Didymodactylos carnosus]CAF4195740.1 unnamed protein product [Didymodactylos carnosus]